MRAHDDTCGKLSETICERKRFGHQEQESCDGIASVRCDCCCDKSADKDHICASDVENQIIGTSAATKLVMASLTIPTAVTCMKHADSYGTAGTNRTTVTLNDSSYREGSDGDIDRECPICMDNFHVGDVVSWSSYETCCHVYHHQCIKEWLLRHNTCPICREVVLPVDQPEINITLKIFKELSDMREQRAQRTYYCARDGLVTLNKHRANSNTKHRMAAATSGTAGATTGTSGVTQTGTFTNVSFQNMQGGSTRQGDSLCVKEKLRAGITKAELRMLRGDQTNKKILES